MSRRKGYKLPVMPFSEDKQEPLNNQVKELDSGAHGAC